MHLKNASTTMINSLESRATKLVAPPDNLQTVAEQSGTQAEKFAGNAKDTVKNTDQVTASAVELKGVVNSTKEAASLICAA